nr:hypothetical protein [Phaeobacter marinintestinus]
MVAQPNGIIAQQCKGLHQRMRPPPIFGNKIAQRRPLKPVAIVQQQNGCASRFGLGPRLFNQARQMCQARAIGLAISRIIETGQLHVQIGGCQNSEF